MNDKFENLGDIEDLDELLASLSEEDLAEIADLAEQGGIDNKIVLNDEDGNEVEFEFIDLIPYEGEEYVVLLPCEDDDGMVVILRIESVDGENETYATVDDEETLNTIFGIFKERAKDIFNFED